MDKNTNLRETRLSDEKAIKLIQKPNLEVQIAQGKKYESSLRVFTEAKTKDELSYETGWKEITSFLDDVFSEKRSARLKQFINYPLACVDITESILTDIYKVFDAQNTFFDFEIEKGQKNNTLRKAVDQMNIVEWIKTQGKKVLKNKPNTVVVVDKDDNGTPYLVMVDNDRIIDCHINEDATLNYVAFTHSVERVNGKGVIRVSFYDAFSYRVFILQEGFYSLETEVSHTAGVCPARMFIAQSISEKQLYKRKVPFTNTLSKLREWSLFDVYQFYADHYGPFPVIEKLISVCEDDDCEGGFTTKENSFLDSGGNMQTITSRVKCQICANKQIMGPGVVVNVPPKNDKLDPDNAGVFRMISPSTANLEYIKEKLVEIEKGIRFKTAGIDTTVNKEAVNEMQMKGSFESRENVLINLKSGFDELYKWTVEVTAKLIIGLDVSITVSANFGTEFYLLSESQLQEKYDNAKKMKLPIEEVDMVYDQLVATKYKGNPSKIGRLELIKLLDPLPHETMEVVGDRFASGLITEQEYFLKGRLITFIDRFERENAPLVEFGKDLELKSRIDKIILILNKYSDEYIKTKSARPTEQPT